MTRVLCQFDVTRRWGSTSYTVEDSVMLEHIDCVEEVLPALEKHIATLRGQMVNFTAWKFRSYLPEHPLKRSTRH